jgi:hypothetical protein
VTPARRQRDAHPLDRVRRDVCVVPGAVERQRGAHLGQPLQLVVDAAAVADDRGIDVVPGRRQVGQPAGHRRTSCRSSCA